MKLLITIETDDETLLGSMGKHIQFYNDKYDCQWRIQAFPHKKIPCGSDLFNDYVRGYNDCIDDLVREDDLVKLNATLKEIEKIFEGVYFEGFYREIKNA